jgi:protein SCO1
VINPMKRLFSTLVCLAAFGSAFAQFYGKYDELPKLDSGRVPSNALNAGVRVDQKLKDFIPLDLKFKNERGETVTTGSLLQDRPVILLPIFYECTGICSIELNKLMESLNSMKRPEHHVGRLADVVIFSIDPTEGPDLAKLKKDTYLELYKAKDGKSVRDKTLDDSWTFLTGDKETVKKLAEAIGFKYRIDERNGDITHPACLVVLTPEGQISRYFLGQEYPQKMMLLALEDAAKDVIGERSVVAEFLSCISVDPHSGQVTVNVMNLIRLLGIATLIGVITAAIVWELRGRKARTTNLGGGAGA